MAYCYLDVSIHNFRTHLPMQWDAIHAKLGQLFIIDPSLKPDKVEKYIQEHLSSARQKWRKLWKVGGDVARLDDYPMDAWPKLVYYWKTPHAKHESEWMNKIHAMVSKPWKQRRMSIIHSMSLEVEKYMYYTSRLHQCNRI